MRQGPQNGGCPYAAPKLELADYWKNLNYDQHRDIRFKMESGLWAKEKGRFPSIFPPGMDGEKDGDSTR